MQTTSRNMANMNTPGYTHQKAVLESQGPLYPGRLKLGLGLKADSVVEFFDRFTTHPPDRRHLTIRKSSIEDRERTLTSSLRIGALDNYCQALREKGLPTRSLRGREEDDPEIRPKTRPNKN